MITKNMRKCVFCGKWVSSKANSRMVLRNDGKCFVYYFHYRCFKKNVFITNFMGIKE